MKVCVSGASGFIGKNLCQNLHQNFKFETTVILRREITEFNVFRKILVKDLCDISANQIQGVNVIVHLAGLAHKVDRELLNNEECYYRENVENALALAEAAVEANVSRFIYLSSINIYGNSSVLPFTEHSSTNPMNTQAKSKKMAEIKLKEFFSSTEVEFVIIRSPLVYGEGVKANFASLMNLVGKGLPLPFRLISGNKRSMVSVYNLVDLIVTCIKEPNAGNQMFLASDDDDLSTAEMVALMAKVQGKSNLALPVPAWFFHLVGKLLNKQDVVSRLTGTLQLDIEHTKNTLNWKPPYSVEHGFKLSVNNK
jgi:UDP-glucose 4-epimerase